MSALARALAATALGITLVTSGCGGDGGTQGDRQPRSSATPKAVIRGWADALRAGDVAKATGFFALPAIVENGTPPLRLRTRGEVRAFNTALPCGARLLKTTTYGRFTTAEFVLGERPGRGRCGEGTGQKARTTFVILDGKIVEWHRVSNAPKATGRIAWQILRAPGPHA
jgi:hypothetical protein